MRFRSLSAAAALVLALTVVGAAAARSSATHVATVKVTAKDFSFVLSPKTVKHGRVTFVIRERRPRAARLRHRRAPLEDDQPRKDDEADGHARQARPLPLPLHRGLPRGARHEGRSPRHLARATRPLDTLEEGASCLVSTSPSRSSPPSRRWASRRRAPRPRRPPARCRRTPPRSPSSGRRSTSTSRTRAPRRRADRLDERREPEAEVAVQAHRRGRVRLVREHADRARRDRLSPGPGQQRLRARPFDRRAQVEAPLQALERRAERRRLRLRQAVRRHGHVGVRARSDGRPRALDAEADAERQGRHRHGADRVQRHRARQHDPGERQVVLRRQRRRNRLRPRRADRQDEVDASTRSPTAPELWGNAKVNSGGGLWYPPAVDAQGRVFLAVANPAPFPGTKPVSERLQPAGAGSLHRLARRPRRVDRQAPLVPAGRPPRRPGLRPPGLAGDRNDPDERDADRGRLRGREDGPRLRLRGGRRQAALAAAGRNAPARHGTAAGKEADARAPGRPSEASRRRWPTTAARSTSRS